MGPPVDDDGGGGGTAEAGNRLRAMVAEQGPVERADGSAMYSMGESSVLVAVYGPGQPLSARSERPDSATVDVEWRDDTGAPSPRDTARESLVRSALESVILLTAHPRSVISVVVQVLGDDGSIVSAAVNAAALALMDAGIEMLGMPTSVTCALKGGAIQVDPTAEFCAAADGEAFLCTLDDGGELLACSLRGKITGDEFVACLKVLKASSAVVYSFMKESMRRRVVRDSIVMR